MLTVASFGARFHRLLHTVIVTVAAVVLAAPLLLGPALGTAVRLLGGADDHHCACGMVRGKCGCPECEELEAERRLDADGEARRPVVKSSCDDGNMLPRPIALPSATVPEAGVIPAAAGERLRAERRALAHPSTHHVRPPIPPPRA